MKKIEVYKVISILGNENGLSLKRESLGEQKVVKILNQYRLLKNMKKVKELSKDSENIRVGDLYFDKGKTR